MTFDTAILRRLEATLRHRSRDLLDGSFAGRWGDEGFVPSGVREYQPGDRMARVHRAATAQTSRTYVWTAEPERAVTAVGVIDLGPSMYFGTARFSKIDIVHGTAFAFGWLFSQRGNRFASVRVGQSIQRKPFRGNNLVPYQLWRQLEGVRTPDGSDDVRLAEGLRLAQTRYRKAEYRIVISDFQSADWEDELKRLGRMRDVVCVQPQDPWEVMLPDVGEANVVDPVSGKQLRINLGGHRGRKVRMRYAELARQRQQHIEDAINQTGARHVVLRTDRDWLTDLVTAFRNRR